MLARQTVSDHAKVAVLQRKCACGKASDQGECESCAQKKIQRRVARNAGQQSTAPRIVHDVLQSGGRPLESATRSLVEPRFGHDFSRVRVHDDDRASRSASAVDAHAYTVGDHVVFASGRYAPQTADGIRLLAHELTHVVQQTRGGGALRRSSVSPPIRFSHGDDDERGALAIGPQDDALEREADRTADTVARGGSMSSVSMAMTGVQRQPVASRPRRRQVAFEGLDEAGPKADFSGEKEGRLYECMARGGADPTVRTPDRTLTWADFSGPPQPGPFGAETHSTLIDLPMDPVRAGCLQRILGRTSDETRVFQAQFDFAHSWGRARARFPTNTANTSCNTAGDPCRQFFRTLPAGTVGGSFESHGTPAPDCDASEIAGSVTAASAAQCKDIDAECTRTAVAESQRLLRHEQGHFNITTEIARQATTAITLGYPLKDVKAAAAREDHDKNKQYDDETDHGCNPGPQASWEADIANHLPKVQIP
jgi:hypothetical protein